MFARDEIDLLEDDIEDIFARFSSAETDVDSMEAHVLQEQVQTESRSDAELSARLGLEEGEDSDIIEGAMSISSDEPHQNMREHPVYQKARNWAKELFSWSEQVYLEGGSGRGDVFRVYVNVKMIPMKLFTALHEESHGDPIGLEVAQQEYQLAVTYLERIMESLSVVRFVTEDQAFVERLTQGAQELHTICVGKLGAIKRRKGAA